jgi:hypothetical protein
MLRKVADTFDLIEIQILRAPWNLVEVHCALESAALEQKATEMSNARQKGLTDGPA